MKRAASLSVFAAVVVAMAVANVRADSLTLTLYSIPTSTGTGATTANVNAIGSQQIQVTATDGSYNPGSGSLSGVFFDFKNVGTVTSTIDAIFLQDGTWLKPPPYIVSSQTTSGVTWTTSDPGQLSGASGVFYADQMLGSEQQGNFNNAKGINNYTGTGTADELVVFFQYQSGKTFSDIKTALDAYAGVGTEFGSTGQSDPSQGLAVGFDVQNIGSTGDNNHSSASYVFAGPHAVGSLTPVPTPLPGTAASGLLLAGAFLGAYSFYRRTTVKVA